MGQRGNTGASTERSRVPRYEALREHFLEQIRSGALQPGDRLPTFVEMRREHGATPTTVDRVYAALAQEGVVTRRRGSGVYVSEQKTANGWLVGVVGSGLAQLQHKLYWAMLLEGIGSGVRTGGRHAIMIDAPREFEGWRELDGLLTAVLQGHVSTAKVPRELPRVSMLYPVDHVDSVTADDFDGARRLTEHLLFLGHRRIAFLGLSDPYESPEGNPLPKRRHDGYQQALKDAGVPFDPELTHGLPWHDNNDFHDHQLRARRGLPHWLEDESPAGWRSKQPTAIIALNDEIAIGAIDALNEAGLRVPEDVSVTGFDGLPWTTYFRPQLTTAEVPLERIGRIAAERLNDRIDQPEAPVEEITLPVEVRVRASTAPCRDTHPLR